MRKITLAHIADKVGVSTVTVYNALSGKKGVGDDLREEILKVADELGYNSKIESKSVKNNKNTWNIGVLISEIYLGNGTSFYSKVYQETAIIATQENCFTMLEVLTRNKELNFELPQIVKEEKVEGLLILGSIKSSYIDMLREKTNIPLVCFDFYDKNLEYDSVIADNFYGMYQMTNYLFENGFKDIAFVGSIKANNSIMDRYFGYAKSMLEHNVEIKDEWIIEDRNLDTGVIEIVSLPENLPEAFACNCDLTAGNLINNLLKMGYDVPKDYSVVGFDNFINSGTCDVEITTYETNIKEMARVALEKVTKCIRGDYSEQGKYIASGHIIVKDSVKEKEIYRNAVLG